MQPATRTIKIHSHRHTHTKATFACVRVCIFCCYHLPSERQLYLVITHVAASLGTICSASGIGSCISTSMSELFEDSSRSLSLISITSSIRSSSTSKIQFLFAFVFTLFFALRQQLFLFRVCTLYLLLHATEKKVAFLLLCVALRWAVVFCLLSVDF